MSFRNNNNNFSNNSSFSISKSKRSDEELSKEIFIHILRINFFNFLKNIKESNRRKLLLINCYFFMIRHAYNPFISNLRAQVKNKKLKQKIKNFQCRIFFNKTKSQINLIKNPNGNKITSVHAYLYYFNNLRKKIMTGFRLNIKINKLNNQRILLLFGIRNKISILFFYREMRKNFVNKENKLQEKICLYIRTKYMKYLIENKKKATEIDEGLRLIRRYQYINNIKIIMNKFNINNLRKLNKEEKNLEKQKKLFYAKKGLDYLKIFSKNKKKYDLIHNKIATKTKMNFLQRVKHKINNKIIANRNFNVLFGLIKKLFRTKYFDDLCQRIDKCLNTKKLQEIFFKRIIIKHLILKVQEKKANNLNLYKLNTKFKKKEKEINFGYLRKIVKLSYIHKHNNKIALMNFEKIYFDKIIKSLKLNKKMKRNKRTLLLKAKRFNEKNIKKKIIEKWKMYISYKKNKRNEYLYVQNKRNEILTKHFIKNLINISSEDYKINNNLNINNLNIDDISNIIYKELDIINENIYNYNIINKNKLNNENKINSENKINYENNIKVENVINNENEVKVENVINNEYKIDNENKSNKEQALN
jgi:hypothetical protein